MMKKSHLFATEAIVLSFGILIFIGSILLSLPIANIRDPQPYINNLFVSTSCVCVTGLTPFVIADQYSLFGQIVMLVLIQLGGLGFITFLYLALHMFRRKITLNTKLVFKEALNQDDFSKLPRLLRTIFYYTFSFELLGAILLSIAFVKDYGISQGIYYGIWHSVSAFCNAGFDLLGSESLMAYATSPLVNITVMILIVAGGLGFLVALDIFDKVKKLKKKCNLKHIIYHLSLHSKIVLLMTTILIVTGAVSIFLFEYNNPDTLGSYSIWDKIMIALFQSVTLRTAGFATVPIVGLQNVTKMMICIFMFIGGSPASTAGGIKTVTFALVVLTVFNVFSGNEETNVFGRRIKKRIFLRAFTLFTVGITLCIVGMMAMMVSDGQLPVMDVMVEIFSSFGTVGLSANVTPQLSFAGKIIDMILMFIGRISPMSLTLLFVQKAHRTKSVVFADEDVIIG